jgi:hypothetical protein
MKAGVKFVCSVEIQNVIDFSSCRIGEKLKMKLNGVM